MFSYYSRYNLGNSEILYSTRGDVNGDGIPEVLFLTGARVEQSNFVRNITLVIRDGRTGRLTIVPLEENGGYDPEIFLGEFNGDGVLDILIKINSGGSGGIMYYYIYTFVGNITQLIFDFSIYNSEYKYTVNYRDNYRVETISLINDRKYIIDISQRDREYLNEIYNSEGILKEPISGVVNPISGLYPVDFDSDGIYELLIYQKIAGRYNADSLGYFLNSLRWDNNGFRLFNQNVAILGGEA